MLLSRKTAFGMIALVLMASAGAWYYSESGSSDGLALTDLDAGSFAQLKKNFNQASENVRVIVLLSPT